MPLNNLEINFTSYNSARQTLKRSAVRGAVGTPSFAWRLLYSDLLTRKLTESPYTVRASHPLLPSLACEAEVSTCPLEQAQPMSNVPGAAPERPDKGVNTEQIARSVDRESFRPQGGS